MLKRVMAVLMIACMLQTCFVQAAFGAQIGQDQGELQKFKSSIEKITDKDVLKEISDKQAVEEKDKAYINITKAKAKLIGIKVDSSSYTVEVGKSTNIIVTATYSNRTTLERTNNSVYVSLNPGIAKVSKTGVITGVKAGRTYIAVLYRGKIVIVEVSVIVLKDIELDSYAYTLNVGKGHSSVVAAVYSNASKKTVNSAMFLSSKNDVAKVSKDGTVTGVASGNAIITASFQGISKVVNVTVVDKTLLSAAIIKAGELKESDFTAGSWASFISALNSAKNINDAVAASQTEVDSALVKLNASKNNLVKMADVKAADEVNAAIAALPAVDNVLFDDEAAINAAKAKYDNLTDTQKQMVTAENKAKLEAVVAKMDALKVWTLKWSDEFNGKNGSAIDSAKWKFETGGGADNNGWGNQEQEIYTNSTDNVYQEDGHLVIAVKKDSTGKITSGRIKTLGSLDMKYGRIDVRAKLPSGTGYWPAVWMMPTDSVYGTWAASGEIDIMENKGRLPGEVYGTLHYGASWPNNKYTGSPYYFQSGTDATSFHTYSLEWEPGEIRWFVDGKLYQIQNNWNTKDSNGEKLAFPAPFDQRFYLILNLAYGGTFDNMQGDGNNLPGKMEVDYARAYELTGRPYKTPVDPAVTVDPLPEGAKQADSSGNLLSNGDFTQPIKDNPTQALPFAYDWNFVHSTDTGNGTQSIEKIDGKNYAKLDITNGGSNNYSVQLIQETTIGKGRWYKLSFDAKSNSSRTIGVKIGGGPSRGYAAYADALTCSLTDQFQTFSSTFQMSADTDLIARYEFELGLNTNPVWIGNVRLEEIPAPLVDYNASKAPLSDGNLIYNGAFDKGNIDRMTYWNFAVSGADASASVPEATRELSVSINNGGAAPESIIVGQKGIQLKNNGIYTLTFKARSTIDRTIKVGLWSKDGTTDYGAEGTFNLTNEMKVYTYSFTMNNPNDIESQLLFKLGGDNNSVFLDDVSLKKGIDYSNIDVYPLKNGDFTQGADGLAFWTPFPNTIGDAASTITVVNGEAKIAITNPGAVAYSIMLNQGDFNFVGNVEYKLAFDARSTIERSILITVENATYHSYFSKTMVLSPTSTHYEYIFVMPVDDSVALKFQLGNVNSAPTAAHDIFIDNVQFEVNNAPIKRAPTLIPSVTNNKLTQPIDITFADDADWRNAITSVKINNIVIAADKYTVSEGKITLFPENFADIGNYTIVVSANGYANTSCVQNIMPNNNLIITNGTFDTDTTGWGVYKGDGSDAAIAAVNGEMKVNFTNYAGWFRYSTQVYQDTIKLEAGKTYVLKFDASSTLARDAWLEMTNMAQQTIALTPETKTFTFEFTAANTITNGKLNFLLGTNNLDGALFTKNQSVTIDNISITEKPAAPPVDTAIITNGTFDTDTTGWGIYTGDGSDAAIAAVNGEMKVNFTNYAGWFRYSTQVYQDTIKLEAGKTYILKFDANSTLARDAWLEMTNMDPQTIALTPEIKTFTFEFTAADTITNGKLNFLLGTNNLDGALFTKNQSVTLDNISITEKAVSPVTKLVTGITVNSAGDVSTMVNGTTLAMSASILPVDATNKSVSWSVTTLEGGTATIDASTGVLTATGEGTVTVTATANDGSGVTGTKVITITAAPPHEDKLITNGDFSGTELAPWGSWSDMGTNTVTIADGEAKIDVSGFGGNSWSVQFFQDGLSFTPNAKYTISFKARSSVNRSFEMDIEGSGNHRYVDKIDNLTTVTTTYTYDFNIDKDETTKLIFFFGKTGTDVDPSVPCTIYIDDIVITKASN